MWQSYAVGMGIVAGLAAGWVGVQAAWARVFPRPGCDPDVLAARGCGRGGCGCMPRRVDEEPKAESPAEGREETS